MPREAWRKTRRIPSEGKPLVVGEAEISAAEVPSEDSRSTWGWVCPWHESEADFETDLDKIPKKPEKASVKFAFGAIKKK